MRRTWIRDHDEWRRERAGLRNIDLYDLGDAVSQGRAVKRPQLAPFVLLEAEQRLRRGTRAIVGFAGVVAVATVLAAWLSAGGPHLWAGVLGLACIVLVGSAAVLVTRRNADRAVRCNAAVLEGVPPREADEALDVRGSGPLGQAGSWIMAAFIVSVLLRASFGMVGGLLVAAGVEIPGPLAVLAGIAGLVIFVLGTVEVQRIISPNPGSGRRGTGS